MILVTGGSGFLGTHICRLLAERSSPVVNFSVQAPSAANQGFLGSLANKITYVEGDVRNSEHLQDSFRALGVSVVVHVAAVNGEDAARRNPALAVSVNVTGTANVMAAAAAAAVRRVVYIGSGTQYGPREDLHPINEDSCSRPIGLYPSTKHAAECIAAASAKIAGIEFVSLRVSAPYGPLETITPSPMHVRFWLDAALSKDKIDCAGADHSRDLTYVGDTAEGIIAAVLAPKLTSPIINIASGELSTIGEVVSVVQRLASGANISVRPGRLASNDPRIAGSARGPLSIKKARTELGFNPRVTLDDGVARYFTWLRAQGANLHDSHQRET